MEVSNANQIYTEILDDRRYITTEEVAEALINQDPSLRLFDVRSIEEYEEYSLPEADPMPINDLLDPDYFADLECNKYKIVFFSNAQLLSDQAWYVSRKKGCQDIYVLKGGLNEWFTNILNPAKPSDIESAESVDLYNLRIAMRNYFLGLSTELDPEVFKAYRPKKAIAVKPKKKVEEEEEEGC